MYEDFFGKMKKKIFLYWVSQKSSWKGGKIIFLYKYNGAGCVQNYLKICDKWKKMAGLVFVPSHGEPQKIVFLLVGPLRGGGPLRKNFGKKKSKKGT